MRVLGGFDAQLSQVATINHKFKAKGSAKAYQLDVRTQPDTGAAMPSISDVRGESY